MSLLGVVCVSLCLVHASGHRIGPAGMGAVQRDEKGVVTAAASGLSLPQLMKKFGQEDLKSSVLGNVVETFSSLNLDDYNMLHMSAALGDTPAIEALLNAGTDVNAQSTEEARIPLTPLDLAKTPEVEKLLEGHGGTKPSYRQNQGFCYAADVGCPHLAQLLVAAGWDPDVRCRFRGILPIDPFRKDRRPTINDASMHLIATFVLFPRRGFTKSPWQVYLHAPACGRQLPEPGIQMGWARQVARQGIPQYYRFLFWVRLRVLAFGRAGGGLVPYRTCVRKGHLQASSQS